MKKSLRKLTALILVLLLPMGALGVLAADTVSGQVVENFLAPVESADPSAEVIIDAQGLFNIRNNLSGNYVLAGNIDLSGYTNWEPIGKSLSAPFVGKLDGQGFKITGLKINVSINSANILSAPAHAVGLFGVCNGAQIKNLEVNSASVAIKNASGYSNANSSIDGTNVYAGILAGYTKGSTATATIIYNCFASGSVKAETTQESMTPYCGGLIGYASDTLVSNSYNLASVSSPSSSMASSAAFAGGLLGYSSGAVVLDRVFNSGGVSSSIEYGDATSGGLVGQSVVSGNYSLRVSDAFNEGNVTATTGIMGGAAFSGGVFGKLAGTVDRVYNSGVVNAKTGMVGGNAYAGGIAGQSVSASIISNSASVQSSVGVSESGGTAYKYRISNGGQKSNNITVSPYTSGSTNDANVLNTLLELSTATPYANALRWDFDGTWEMVQGKTFPQLAPLKVSEDDYVTQHLIFLDTLTWNKNITENRWAHFIWSELNTAWSNAGEALYNVIDGLIASDFPDLSQDKYKILLSDYIMNQGTMEFISNSYEINLDPAYKKTYNSVKSFLQNYWKPGWDELSDEDLFWLFHYNERTAEEWIDMDFQDHLAEIVAETKGSGQLVESLFGAVSGTANEIFGVIDSWSNVTRGLTECINYSIQVDAFINTTEEFKEVLERMEQHIGGIPTAHRIALADALNTYTDFISDSDTGMRAELWADFFIRKIAGQFDFIGKAKDLLIEKTQNWFMGLITSGAASYWGPIIKWTAKATWGFMEYITKNGTIIECREFLRANYHFESALYAAMMEIKDEFQGDSSFRNAKLFDAAYNFYEEAQIYSLDQYALFLDTNQQSWVQIFMHGLSNSFNQSEIEEIQMEKLELYNSYCHGTTYEVGGKLITIACPTDVTVYDSLGGVAVKIVANKLVECRSGIAAAVANDVKLIAVPLNENYSIDIKATDNGSMDYYVSEYDQNFQRTRSIIYEDLDLISENTYSGEINNVLNTPSANYDLTNGANGQTTPATVVPVTQFVPVQQVTLSENEKKINAGESFFMNAAVMPNNATMRAVTWYSMDETVATVSANGTVTGVDEGQTDIIAMSIDGGVSDVCTVTVDIVPIPPVVYAVTVNGGAGSGSYTANAIVNITANAAPSGKVFDKWITSSGIIFTNANAASTSFTMPAKNVTVTATYKDVSAPVSYIFNTRYESNILNWLVFILLFGFVWMWF